MIPGKALKPEDILEIAVRRWRLIVLPFLLVSLAGALVVRRLPNVFRSETLILVVPQRVPESYVKSTVTSRIEDRLRSINQQITSRTRLEPVIKEFNLYPAQVQTGLMEDVIERMRRDIETQIIRGDAFRISYVSGDARTAMKVTEKLASMYIDESLRDREVLADSTNQFLDSQLTAAKERLLEHEKKLEAYKVRFSGQLPTQVQANLQVMQNGQMQVQSLVDSLNRDRDRRLTLEGQLADLGVTLSADTPAAEEAPKAQPPGPMAQRLAVEQKALDELRVRLKDTHPDVARQQRVVADLQKKAADEAAIVALVPKPTPVVNTNNSAEIARMNRIAQIRVEIDALNRQITQKEGEEARLRGVIGEYQGRVEAAPAREAELTELMRDYETLQRSYTSLLTKKEEAQVAANLERHQIGEQFKILDPARMPERPVSPNRRVLYAGVAGAGLLCGLLLAGFFEYRDSSLKTEGDVVLTLALPVLAMIPELMTIEQRHSRRRRRRWLSVATAGAAVLVVVIVAWVLRS